MGEKKWIGFLGQKALKNGPVDTYYRTGYLYCTPVLIDWPPLRPRPGVPIEIKSDWKNYVGEFLHEKIRLEQLNVDLYQGTGSVSGKFSFMIVVN